MNQPILNHQPTQLLDGTALRGSFNGTYDLGSEIGDGANGNSYYEVVWENKIGVGSWVFSHKLKTSKKYPWLMLYLRADAIKGFSGAYHYDTRGMIKTKIPEMETQSSEQKKQPSSAAASCRKKKSEEATFLEDVKDHIDEFIHASMDEHKSCFKKTAQKMFGMSKIVAARNAEVKEVESSLPLRIVVSD